jgi:uncharacterized protein (DUF427 family)
MVEPIDKIPGSGHPITIEPHSKHVVITYKGEVIADTRAALRLTEASYAPVLYIPRGDVEMTKLTRSAHATTCPYKGECAYYNLPAGETRAANAVWTYETPYDSVKEIREHLAFYPDRVEITETAA